MYQVPFIRSSLAVAISALALCAGEAVHAASSPLPIYTIQGTSHQSSYVNQSVLTSGVVTAVDPFGSSRGFYLQDLQGDGDERTSDALFVFTGSSSPTVAVGDLVQVNGTVKEFKGSANDLTLTEITGATVTKTGTAALPAAIRLGMGGRMMPTEVIEDDNFGSFDASHDGIDYWESLEGMHVTLPNAQVVQPKFNNFGEFYAVADQGIGATGMNSRGGITIAAGDYNPERIQIDDDFAGSPFPAPVVNTGDRLGDITGVIGYGFGAYELQATALYTPTSGGLASESSTLAPKGHRLTVASYNVLNLDPGDGSAKFVGLAEQITHRLNTPDIIALQEIQDSTGATNNGITDAAATYQKLIDAIAAAGGPRYQFADVAPSNNSDGGEPGGNIRVGYLWNADRVTLLESVARLPGADADAAFADSRKPLLGRFQFNGEEITLINNHFASKGGSSPIYGAQQPFLNGQEDQRIAQAEFVNNYVAGLLGLDPGEQVIVLGDFNEFGFEDALISLRGTPGSEILTDLADLLAPNERYSYIFDGNSQQLDHIFVTSALRDGAAPQFDIVHLNSEFAQGWSDHDPLLASLAIGAAPVPVPASGWLLLSAMGLLLHRQRSVLN